MKRTVLSFLLVVMLLSFPAHAAYGADDQVKESGTKSGEVSDWATLFGWLSDINGHLGLIYSEMGSLSASVDFDSYFNYPINNNLTMRHYLYAMFQDIGNISTKLTADNAYFRDLVSTTQVSGKLGLYDVVTALNNVNTSVGAINDTNTLLGQLMSSSTQSGQIRLRNLANLLQNIDSDMDTLISAVGDISISQTLIADLTDTNDLLETANDWLSHINENLSGIRSSATTINTNLNTLHTDLSNINSNLQTQTTTLGNKLDSIISGLSGLSSPTVNVNTSALETLVNRTNNNLSIIEGQLDRILLYLVVSDVQDDLIGDFDWLGLGEEISALSEEASDKIPFSALGFFVSLTQLSVFNSTPSRLPEITIPFNFSGSDQTLIISNAMMNQAQPYIHFAVLLMFMYCLAVVTMRFVYHD